MKFCKIILLLLVSFVFSCGGGTTGTGELDLDSLSTGSGTIKSIDGNFIDQAKLTVLETGETALSDSAGNFNISWPTQESINLLVEANGIEKTIPLNDLALEEESYDINLEVDFESEDIVLVSFDIKVIEDEGEDEGGEDAGVSPPKDTEEQNIDANSQTEKRSIFNGFIVYQDDKEPISGIGVKLNNSITSVTNAEGKFSFKQVYKKRTASISVTFNGVTKKETFKVPEKAFELSMVFEVKRPVSMNDGNGNVVTSVGSSDDIKLVSSSKEIR